MGAQLRMPTRQQTPMWQDIRRTLSSKSKTALLNLLRDVYALTPENQDFVRTQALAPKGSPRRTGTVKDVRRGTTFEVVVKGKASKATPN